MGTAVSREIQTDNGVIVFLGTAEGDGLIRRNYPVVGGTCEPTGTGFPSPWDYCGWGALRTNIHAGLGAVTDNLLFIKVLCSVLAQGWRFVGIRKVLPRPFGRK